MLKAAEVLSPGAIALPTDVEIALLSGAVNNLGVEQDALGERMAHLEREFKYAVELTRLSTKTRGWMGVEFLETSSTHPFTPEARQAAIREARRVLEKAVAEFSDLETRLHYFMKVKEQVSRLCDVLRVSGDKYAAQTADVLYDALRFSWSEDLDLTQLGAVGSVLNMLASDGMRIADAISADRILSEVGLDSIPSGEDV